jgi:uncharacterized protein (DUF488 family)
MKFPFFTIGHSTRPIGEFIDLLTASEIGIVVDVRTVPRSRTNPQYNREALPESLSGFQIAYEHVAELGGLRARAKDIAPDVNAFWQNQSFHNYADYAMSGGFRSGLARLRDLGRVRRCAVMCAEAVPSSDHRGLPRRRWRAGVSYSWAGQGHSSEPDAGGPAWAERHGDLSAASGGSESMNESVSPA